VIAVLRHPSKIIANVLSSSAAWFVCSMAAHCAVAFEVVWYAQSEAGKARCASVPQQPLQPSSNNRPVGIEIVTM
jgi:hypothetical protein